MRAKRIGRYIVAYEPKNDNYINWEMAYVHNQGYTIGIGNTALTYQNKIGRYSSQDTAGTTGDVLTVGIGTDTTAKNSFRVDYSGRGYFSSSVSGTGADVSEFYEWEDGNPNNDDRVGYFAIVVSKRKVRLANENDDVNNSPSLLRRVGVVAENPGLVANDYSDEWRGKYLRDIFNRPLLQHKVYEAEYGEDGNLIRDAYEADEFVLNPDFNPDEEYIPRSKRPEWIIYHATDSWL